MDLEQEQYQRNKELIAMAVSATTIILENLGNAEEYKYAQLKK